MVPLSLLWGLEKWNWAILHPALPSPLRQEGGLCIGSLFQVFWLWDCRKISGRLLISWVFADKQKGARYLIIYLCLVIHTHIRVVYLPFNQLFCSFSVYTCICIYVYVMLILVFHYIFLLLL